MKNIFAVIVFCICCCISVSTYAQIRMASHSIIYPDSIGQNFYQNETARGDFITYKIDHSLNSLYRISNVNNTRIGQFMTLKNGAKQIEPLNVSLEMASLDPVYRAFIDTFTPEEIRVLAQNNEILKLGYALDESGSILEVGFTMYRDHPHLYNIPPQYLEKIETQLKSSAFYKIPEDMRQRLREYNVITVVQNIPFKGLVDKL